nr:uncharacterized protein LOC125634275 [Caretta caretta]
MSSSMDRVGGTGSHCCLGRRICSGRTPFQKKGTQRNANICENLLGHDDFLEEEEEEDSAQAASGESVLPSSQELFITLEPIPSTPSQGGLGDHDAGEGTSGANVSTCPLSTPSQRLAQIRRQKKHTRDDMFAELMQSTRTDRAQLNAGRETMAESRNKFSDCDESRQDAMLKLMGEQTDVLRCLVDLMREKQQEHSQPLYNRSSLFPKFNSLFTQMPKNTGREEAPGIHSFHPRGLPKQQKAGIS